MTYFFKEIYVPNILPSNSMFPPCCIIIIS